MVVTPLLTFPPIVPRLYGEIGMIGKKSRDAGVEQCLDLLAKIAPAGRIARRS
jgi:hypothetical protein